MKKLKILIVEDEAIIAIELQNSLRKLNYDICQVVAKGTEAVEVAKREKPDLVLLDIRLAGAIDGIETGKIIAEHIKTSFIFLTGYLDRDIKKHALVLNPLAYLQKPLQISEIDEVIKRNFF